MGDDIEINVTETTNIIEITPQPNDQIVDIAVTDNAPNVEINVTPSVIEINVTRGSSTAIWGGITGNIDDQTDLATKFGLKADLVDGKVPSSQLPSYVDDVIEVANYAALPITGESGKIYVTIDNNHIFRWTGSTYVEITDNTAVWGAITGTLSSQTDLQSALNAKVPYTGASGNINLGEYGLTAGYLGLDITPTSTPIGIGTIYWDAANRTAALIDGDGDTTLQIGQEERILVHNNTGSTLIDGQVVYVTGSTGELPSVSLANAGAEATSAATIGVVTESIANGSDGFITTSGIVHGLNTLAFNEGDLLWLGTTSGTFTTTKPTSPNHLVLIGYVIKKSGGNGSILVKIQNTQELAESSDVLFNSLANNDVLTYESSSSLWKNKSLSTILGYTPANDSLVVHLSGTETISGTKTFSSGSTIWDNDSSSILDFKISGTSVANFNFGSTFTQFISKTTSGYLFKNSTLANSLTIDNSGNGTFLGSLTASSIIKSGGTSSQFLKADGSVDSSTYALTSQLHNAVTIGTANGLSLSTQVLSLGLSSSTLNGALSSTDWVTFNNKVESVSANLPLGSTGGKTPIISITQATTSTDGYLSSIDWNTFNGKQTALNGTGFVKVSGTTISYDNSTYVPTSRTLTINGTTYDLSANRSWTISAGISGSGTTGKIPLYTGSTALGDSSFTEFSTYLNLTKPLTIAYSTATSGTGLNLSLNNASSTGTTLYVFNAGTGNLAQFQKSDNTAALLINASGNVGIGTTTPDYPLEIIGTFSLKSADGNTQGFTIKNNISTDEVSLFNYYNSALILGTNNTERLRITSTGNVNIGTLGTGILYSNSGTLTSTNPSDRRLKDEITDLEFGLNEILQLRPVSYIWKNDTINQGKQYGFIAQEVQEVMPELVKEFETKDGEEDVIRLGLDKEAIFVTLINAIKELKAEIDLLKTK